MRLNPLNALLITAAVSLSPLASAFTLNSAFYDGSITFGSGLKQDQPQPIWKTIVASKPQGFVFLGNHLDIDSNSDKDLAPASRIKQAYLELWNNKDFQYFGRATTQHDIATFATWGPKDYALQGKEADLETQGLNKEQFGTFFGIDVDEMGDSYETGVFHAEYMDIGGLRVQLILLDTESYRSPLQYSSKAGDCPAGSPVANTSPGASLLGETQWVWLEEALKEDAQVRIIASGIQILPEAFCGEKWANFPAEREKLFNLIKSESKSGVMLISGGRELGEISRLDNAVGYPLYEVTSGGLNTVAAIASTQSHENPLRIGEQPISVENFGKLRLHREKGAIPKVDLEILDIEGKVLQKTQFELTELYPPTPESEDGKEE